MREPHARPPACGGPCGRGRTCRGRQRGPGRRRGTGSPPAASPAGGLAGGGAGQSGSLCATGSTGWSRPGGACPRAAGGAAAGTWASAASASPSSASGSLQPRLTCGPGFLVRGQPVALAGERQVGPLGRHPSCPWAASVLGLSQKEVVYHHEAGQCPPPPPPRSGQGGLGAERPGARPLPHPRWAAGGRGRGPWRTLCDRSTSRSPPCPGPVGGPTEQGPDGCL